MVVSPSSSDPEDNSIANRQCWRAYEEDSLDFLSQGKKANVELRSSKHKITIKVGSLKYDIGYNV